MSLNVILLYFTEFDSRVKYSFLSGGRPIMHFTYTVEVGRPTQSRVAPVVKTTYELQRH